MTTTKQPNKRGRPVSLSIKEKEERAAEQERLRIEQEAAAALLPKKQKGRPKNENYLPYAEAREVMLKELLHSRSAFEHWWEREKPKTIPRFPYRVYKDWVSWNDFLGTNNEFRTGAKTWRPFKEAIQFVHSLRLTSQREWLEYCKEHSETVPEDIPRRPDVVYNQWTSWAHWLGNKPIEVIAAAKEREKVSNAVYYIIHEQGVPGNVITYGVEPTGITALKDWWEHDKYDVIGMFQYEQDKGTMIKQLVESMSTPYLGEERQRITPNVWQIVETLQTILCTIPTNRR